jgi:hypothetical protein
MPDCANYWPVFRGWIEKDAVKQAVPWNYEDESNPFEDFNIVECGKALWTRAQKMPIFKVFCTNKDKYMIIRVAANTQEEAIKHVQEPHFYHLEGNTEPFTVADPEIEKAMYFFSRAQ